MKAKLVGAAAAAVFVAVILGNLGRPPAGRPGRAATAPFIAFSLKQAESRLRVAPASIHDLGISRPIGLVYDRKRQDLIVVGRAAPHEKPLTIADLEIAIRSRMPDGSSVAAWPLVSIDRTRDTPLTGQEVVRFEGGVRDSGFGSDMLEADLTLKRIGLSLIDPEIPGVRSYVALSAEELRQGAKPRRVNTRFWFVPVSDTIATRRDVFVVQHSALGIRAQVISSSGNAVDPPGEEFARDLTEHFDGLEQRPEIRRLKSLFDLVGIAEGIRTLPGRPDLAFWRHTLRLPVVRTPREYPLLRKSGPVRTRSGSLTMTISGGIEMRALISSARGGDATALRDLVLRSRPAPDSLSWQVPLSGWNVAGISAVDGPGPDTTFPKNVPGTTLTKSFGRAVGAATGSGVGLPAVSWPIPASIQKHILRAPPPEPRGGIRFIPSRVRVEHGGEGSRPIQARPAPDSLVWAVPLPKESDR